MLTNSIIGHIKPLNTQKVSTESNIQRVSFGNSKDQTSFSTTLKEPKKSIMETIIDFFKKIFQWFKIEKNEDHKLTDINSATKRLKKANQVMTDIARIIEEDQKREVPVFKQMRIGTYQKIFNYAYRRPDRPFMVGISGGSASGKSYVTKKFVNEMNEKCPVVKGDIPTVSVIHQDNYYHDFSKIVNKKGYDAMIQETNLDHPDSINMKQLEKDAMKIKAGFAIKTPKYFMDGTGKS
ncbi:MAG: uridine kinase, partial [Vampirovibrionia bacterium]